MKTTYYSVITGASKGLGKALAIECAKRGFNLVLVALPGENVLELSNALTYFYNIKAIGIEADLTRTEELNHLISTINNNYKVNMLINNAGIGGSARFQDISSQYIDNILMLNIRALSVLTHDLLPNIKAAPKGYILNIASMASFGPIPFKTVYPASKAFVYSFSRGLSFELYNSNVIVSVAHPGGMKTNSDVTERINRHNGIIRSTILSPEKVAHICIRKMLKGYKLIIPGITNKLCYLFIKTCPVRLQLNLFRAALCKEIAINNGHLSTP